MDRSQFVAPDEPAAMAIFALCLADRLEFYATPAGAGTWRVSVKGAEAHFITAVDIVILKGRD